MGYTHYWSRKRVLPGDLFRAAVDDCRKVCQDLAIPLGDAGGHGKPIFNNSRICFNGHVESGRLVAYQQVPGLIWPDDQARGVAVAGEKNAVVGGWGAGPRTDGRVLGPDGNGMYETFDVERIYRPDHRREEPADGWWHDFCKTNYRPYDLCVQCCLIVLDHRLGGELFRVSSDGTSAQWDDAREACQRLLGFGAGWGEGELAAVQVAA